MRIFWLLVFSLVLVAVFLEPTWFWVMDNMVWHKNAWESYAGDRAIFQVILAALFVLMLGDEKQPQHCEE